MRFSRYFSTVALRVIVLVVCILLCHVECRLPCSGNIASVSDLASDRKKTLNPKPYLEIIDHAHAILAAQCNEAF